MARNATGQAERRTLTRELIVQAAITIIERDGAQALSMRKVAAELGVGVMSLYNHIPHRDALVEEVARTVLDGLDLPADRVNPDQDWKINARVMMDAFRATAERHPRSMYLVLTSKIDLVFKWRAAERALVLLDAAGFDGETSVRALRALMSYAIGSQMMRAEAVKLPDDSSGPAFRAVREEPERYPRTIALARHLLRPDPDADFECGLRMLLSALDRLPRTSGG